MQKKKKETKRERAKGVAQQFSPCLAHIRPQVALRDRKKKRTARNGLPIVMEIKQFLAKGYGNCLEKREFLESWNCSVSSLGVLVTIVNHEILETSVSSANVVYIL